MIGVAAKSRKSARDAIGVSASSGVFPGPEDGASGPVRLTADHGGPRPGLIGERLVRAGKAVRPLSLEA